jgi:branched-chain amino acid transport system ATP-binding protein
MIALSDVTAGYGDGADILQGVSFTAVAREIVTVLGPNGCGKSTLLKCIAGYVAPRQGSIRIRDQDVSEMPVHTKVRHLRIGIVPQVDNVFATLTVAENILLAARGLSRPMREQRFAGLMESYPQLATKTKRRASALSGGERQLLSLARALIADPEILLLDEPSAGLSPAAMHDVFDAIADARDRNGLCIVMVEQNAFEALNVADRAYVLSLGRVALEDRAAELIANPAMRHLYLGGSPSSSSVRAM